MRRRDFVALAAIAPGNLDRVKLRKAGKVETVFKSPGPHPNGLQATKDGLWILDQGDNKAYLVSYEDGKVLRHFATESDRGSGITFDGEALWLGSTYNRQIICSDASTGKTLARYFTPGAGVIYKTAWDPPARSSPLTKPSPSTPSTPVPPNAPGTGAHGLEFRNGKLWIAVPPARMIYRVDPKTWVVEQQFATAGNRPHGIG